MSYPIFHSPSALRRKGRRRGISLWLFAASLPIIVGTCGLVIDMGQLYACRAQAQRAADAAALAGAEVSDGSNDAVVISTGTTYAAKNGFDPNSVTRPAQVRIIPHFTGATGGGVQTYENSVYASVATNEPVYFSPILETLLRALGQSTTATSFSRRVSASARAISTRHLPMSMGGVYGVADPNKSPVEVSVFGPEGHYDFGDKYSTQFLEDGGINPDYQPLGSIFSMNVSSDYLSKNADGLVHLQIFDPDCYSPGGQDSYDEIRQPNPNNRHDATHPDLSTPTGATTTRYEVWKDGKLLPGVTATYGSDATTDHSWVEPPNFAIDTNVYGPGQYEIRVKSLAGSSENGFLLRAGPTAGLSLSDDEWNKQYGDIGGTAPNNVAVPISAQDHLQLNFIKSGKANFSLGYVPASLAGNTFGVSKFDVDIASTDLYYTCDTLPGQTFKGYLPPNGNGVTSVDSIQLPADYKGGNWSASYTAGATDTSDWQLLAPGKPDGEVRLVD